ncbi:MAG: hypothetical protein HY882_13340, partial [Deltaproteobacteria bacterium]|nr:hypothetical protein [Deltaproteobacteria bacterium]
MKGSLLKRVLVFVLWLFFLLSLLPTFADGEVQTITHSVRQTFGGSQSPDDARIAAVARAKREPLEMAGTYVESLTVVKNAQVEKDMILVLTAGVVQAEVISQKHYHTEDAFGIEVVVRVSVDTAVLEEQVGKLRKDRTYLEQLKKVRQNEKELLDKVAKLEEENRRLMAEKKSSEKLKERFQEVSQALTAVEWLDRAVALWDTNVRKVTDPGKAIEYLNKAIHLKPDYAEAYGNRGLSY